MPFKKNTVMEQKLEFVKLALKKDTNLSELCRRYAISRPTAYKWLSRYRLQGNDGLVELSRRPKGSPIKSSSEVERFVIDLRKQEPEWGAKKIRRLLQNGIASKQYNITKAPACSTITKILDRHGLIDRLSTRTAASYESFEHAGPNELWQMDFKGYFPMLDGNDCHALTITDDHSRFNMGLFASTDERRTTVEALLIKTFKKYGLPLAILCDNGSPWGSAGQHTNDGQKSFTRIEKWLFRLNIDVIHGRPYHPQTQGKEERFHRTLKNELLKYKNLKDVENAQEEFDAFRKKYNHYRPHEALGQDTPDTRYEPSPFKYPLELPEITYRPNDMIRTVDKNGFIYIKQKKYRMGKAFAGDPLALRPKGQEQTLEVYFCNKKIRTLYLKSVKDVPSTL